MILDPNDAKEIAAVLASIGGTWGVMKLRTRTALHVARAAASEAKQALELATKAATAAAEGLRMATEASRSATAAHKRLDETSERIHQLERDHGKRITILERDLENSQKGITAIVQSLERVLTLAIADLKDAVSNMSSRIDALYGTKP